MATANLDWVGISAIALAALVAAALIVLLKKGLITHDTVTATGDLLDSLPVFADDGFVGQLYNYARIAVMAVEQLVKAGALPKDDEVRKAEALEQVERYAKLDGVELGDTDRDALGDLIEAAVAELPHG